MTDPDTSDGEAFLTALRLADSFLPVGTHTASYGLEQYLNENRVTDADELAAVLEGYLRQVVGPAETVALAAAYDAVVDDDPEGLLAADRRLHAVTMPREFRESSTTAGGKLLDLLAATDTLTPTLTAFQEALEADETPGHYAIVAGAVLAGAGLSREQAILVQGYGFVSELLGAAQRLGRFGHTEIQQVLADLLPVVATLPAFADRDLAAMGSFAPLAEIMGMRHERAERRLFAS